MTIDNPGHRNALDADAVQAFITAVELAQRDEDVRAVLVTGAGESFCGGFDIGVLSDHVPYLNLIVRSMVGVRHATSVSADLRITGEPTGGGCCSTWSWPRPTTSSASAASGSGRGRARWSRSPIRPSTSGLMTGTLRVPAVQRASAAPSRGSFHARTAVRESAAGVYRQQTKRLLKEDE